MYIGSSQRRAQILPPKFPARIISAWVLVLVLQPPAHAEDNLDAQTQPVIATPPTPDSTALMPASYAIEGPVSFYGREFAGRKTSSGERFDPNGYTMAHRTLPFGTMVRITNLYNNKQVVVRVNDRGPFTGGRVGDVSAIAARALDMLRAGVVAARLEVVNLSARE